MHSSSRTLPIVFAIILVDMLGVGILIPVIPLLLADPTNPYYLGLPLAQGIFLLGLLTAVFPLGQFIATPILGQLSDRFGRKPVLALSIAGTSLSYIVFAIGIITQNIPLLFISRALDGATGGNISVAQAAIADSTPPERRARNFGIIGAAFGIGFIIGPFLGGRLSDASLLPWFDATTPFWFAAALAAVNVVVVLLFFKETNVQRSAKKLSLTQSFSNIARAARDHTLRPLFLSSFLFQAGFSSFTTFFGVFLIAKFGFTQTGIGDFFALIGVCIVFTQAIITGYAARKWSGYRIVLVSLFGVSLTLFFFYLAQAPWQLYLITFPNAVFVGLIMANLTGLISTSVGPERQGEVLGINASVQALAQALPPIFAGVLASIAADLPILMGSVITLLAALCFLVLCKPRHT